MADDVVIGSASVQIVGDYSGLEKSFNDAQSLAQSAGQKISAGLESGAAGAKSLTNAAEMTDEQVQHLFDDGMKLAEAWTKVHGSTVQVAEGMAKLKSEMGGAAASTEGLGDSFKRVRNDAESFEKAWGEALVENKRRTEDLANATTGLESSILSVVAAVVSFQALKQLGEDSLMAYGRVQQLTTSLDMLGAGAKGAEVEVANLRTLAVQLAIPFENLTSKAQSLAAQFGTGEGLNAVIIAAANAAAGSGKSFDAAAAALEGVEIQGAVTRGTLKALGLSWEDLANSMGISVEEARDKFKKGSQNAAQDVADIIDAINAKYHDAAERQAQNTLGIWVNLKNQSTFIFQQIGEQMGGLGPLLSDALKVVASGVTVFIGGIQQVTVAVIGMVREGIDAISGLGHVALAAMKGDFIGVAQAATAAYSKIKTDSEYTNQSLEDHAKKTAETLISIWADSSKKISAAFKPNTGGGGGQVGLTNEQYRTMVLEIDAETAHQKALIQIKRLGYQEDEKLHKVSAEQNLSRLQALNDQELAITEAGIQKKLALQKQKGEGSKDAGLYKAEQKAEDAAAIESIKLQQHVTQVKEQLFDEEVKYHVKQLNEELKFDREVAAHVNKLNTEMADDRLKALALETVGEEKHQVAALEMARSRAAYEQSIGQISASQRIAIDRQIDSAEDDIQKKAIQREIELLDKKSGANVDYASKKQALENQLQAMEDKRAAREQTNIQKNTLGEEELNNQLKKQIENYQKVGDGIGAVTGREMERLQLEIQLNTLQGKSSNSEIIALTNMKAATSALASMNNFLGETYAELGHTITSASGSLSGAIAQLINGAGSFYKAWHQAMNQFEAQLVGTVIKAVIDYGVHWVQVNILGMSLDKAKNAAEIAGIGAVSAARATATAAQLAQITAVTAAQSAATATITAEQLASFVAIKVAATALDVSEVLGDAAVGGAAAAASTAAIPIIGPALALEAGAAMYASIAGIYTPLATFSEGGMVPEDMLALVHKGEYVLPAEKTAQAMVGGSTGPSAGETHLHFDFSGAHFTNGISDNQVASIFNRGFRLSKLAGALPPGRFPQ